MKLLHLNKEGQTFYVMVENTDAGEIRYACIKPGEPEDTFSVFQMTDYEDRKHFAGVIGKFMPEVWIWDEEYDIEIDELSLDELNRAADIKKKRDNETTGQ